MSQAVRPVERTTLGEDTRGARMIGVARLTGVSHQTVSRALNAHPQGASADSRTSRLGDRSARIQRMGAVRRLSRRTTRLARAGARFVDDIAPFEQRKLWLLNGGHSLLAYAGSARGHETIAEAVTDPKCRAWLQDWWVEASRHLTLPAEEVAAYRDALLDRFGNPRIRHLLAQIAADGSQKLPVRILPTVRRERAQGSVPAGALRVVAA